jgi:hypothetical protein
MQQERATLADRAFDPGGSSMSTSSDGRFDPFVPLVLLLALLACKQDPAPAPAPAPPPVQTANEVPVGVTAPEKPRGPAAPSCVRANISTIIRENGRTMSFGMGGKCQDVKVGNGGADVSYRCSLSSYGKDFSTGRSAGGLPGGTITMELRQKDGDRYSGTAYAQGRREGSVSITYANKFDDAKGTFAAPGKAMSLVLSPCKS